MAARTLWTALTDGDPGVVFGASLAAFALAGMATLLVIRFMSRQVSISDPEHPTVFELQRQQPNGKEDWLRQRVEAYRSATRIQTAKTIHRDTLTQRRQQTSSIAVATVYDWSTAGGRPEAEILSARTGPDRTFTLPALHTPITPQIRLGRHPVASSAA